MKYNTRDNKKIKTKGGISILGILVFGIILLVTLSYFNINLKGLVESPTIRENFEYVGGVVENIWNNHLKNPLTYFWEKIILKNIENIKENNIFNSENIDQITPELIPSQE